MTTLTHFHTDPCENFHTDHTQTKMRENLLKLPEEMEREIRDFVITNSFRLQLLLNRYPLDKMDTFFRGFTKQELDRIYRYGCIEKVLEKKNDWYTWGYVNKNIKELLKDDERTYILFTYTSWPTSQFNEYWRMQSKTRQPSKAQYISNISHFCNFALTCSQNTQNEQFIQFCEKLVYEVIAGSLIMRKNNLR